MAAQSQLAARRGLVKRFNVLLVFVYGLSILITAPTTYFYTTQQVYSRAEQELVLMVDVVNSIQDYVGKDLRPHFVKENIFYSPSFSGIVAVSRFAEYFKGRQSEYYIHIASDNPLNPNNQAQGLEQELLDDFRIHREQKALTSVGNIRGKTYLVNSSPKVSAKGCLLCHGKPSDAPQDVTETYGTQKGYYYDVDEVVGVSLVGVPLDNVQELAIKRSLIVIGGITVLFAILFIVVNLLVKRLVLTPISEITDVAMAVSKGDLTRDVRVFDRNDEISDLANAFELMRRSLLTAMKKISHKS